MATIVLDSKVNHIQLKKEFTIAVAGLGIWLYLTFIVLFLFDEKIFLLEIAIIIMTVTLSLMNLIHNIGWYSTILGSLLFTLVLYILGELNSSSIIVAGTFYIALIVTTLLSNLVVKQISPITTQLEYDYRMKEDSDMHDPNTGLLLWKYAIQFLKSEIVRSQRYEENLSLLSIQVKEEILEKDNYAKRNILKQVADIILASMRQTDIAFIKGDKFGIILTGIDMNGTMVLGQRLIEHCANAASIPIYIGVAYFPKDGDSDEELIRASEAAMQLAASKGEAILLSVKTDNAYVKSEKKEVEKPIDMSSKPDKLNANALQVGLSKVLPSNVPTSKQSQITSIGILGKHSSKEVKEYRNIFSHLPKIDKVEIFRNTDDLSIFNIKHHSDSLLQDIRETITDDSFHVRQGKNWIEIRLEK